MPSDEDRCPYCNCFNCCYMQDEEDCMDDELPEIFISPEAREKIDGVMKSVFSSPALSAKIKENVEKNNKLLYRLKEPTLKKDLLDRSNFEDRYLQ